MVEAKKEVKSESKDESAKKPSVGHLFKKTKSIAEKIYSSKKS